ncbi:MAG: 3-dehydroquinate synthase [Actinobacteria bacterium]|nr:3-dehydroquinate synthase [Actinomycetota bacterium]
MKVTDSICITVRAEHSYEVHIGSGCIAMLPSMLTGAGRLAIIYQRPVLEWVELIRAQFVYQGALVVLIEVPEGEAAKSAAVLEECWQKLGELGFTRNDAVIAVGGGAVTDLAGFVAATWLRGIRNVNVPTTLLGMVDAAVGGKTGINSAAGKNLVGAFHSPVGVICDLDTLITLPRPDLVAGMAEVAKIGLTSDPTILADLRRDVTTCCDPSSSLMADLIRRAVQVKADVVGGDFKELSSSASQPALGREVLNYGHTFGHAIERVEDYRWRHGEAISVGMIFVAELARLGGRLGESEVATHREILGSLGLPTSYAPGRWEQLLAAMQVDKKARGNTLRFVILTGIGHPVEWSGPDPDLLLAAYESLTA